MPSPPSAAVKTNPDLVGHRKRLRERFLKSGPHSVSDYEFLELILFRAIPRRDVKNLAKQLIRTFGDLGGAVNASEKRLSDIPGLGAAAIFEMRLFAAAAARLARARIINRPLVSSLDQLLDYCRVGMGYEAIEQFRILFLDRKNTIIADEKQQQGTVDHTPVYPREIVKRALELSATAVILVHNHPSGDPTPSRADIEMTQRIVNVAKPLNIAIHDHIVICKTRHYSFRQHNLL